MPTPQTTPLRGPAAAVARALAATEPIVHMWRDGLTVIALASGLPDRKPDYLTFEQATEGGAIEVQEAAVQAVPTVEANVGPMPVLLLGGDTIVGLGRTTTVPHRLALMRKCDMECLRLTSAGLDYWVDVRAFSARGRWIAVADIGGDMEVGCSSSRDGALLKALEVLGAETALSLVQSAAGAMGQDRG